MSGTLVCCLTKAVVVGGMGLVCRHNRTEDFGSLQSVFAFRLLRRYSDDIVEDSWKEKCFTKNCSIHFPSILFSLSNSELLRKGELEPIPTVMCERQGTPCTVCQSVARITETDD